MKIIDPSYKILTPFSKSQLKLVELAARTCYKSEGKITPDSAEPFVKKICQVYKHESVLEHTGFTVKFICDRGVSHELVRHRHCAFSQESTRYVAYKKEITVIRPLFVHEAWVDSCEEAERCYLKLLEAGVSPQHARGVLPTSLKTELVVTANWREWRHIFALRCAPEAHPQMRQLMVPLRDEMCAKVPSVFSK